MNDIERKLESVPDALIRDIYLNSAGISYYKGQDGIIHFVKYYESECGHPMHAFIAVMRGENPYMKIPLKECQIEYENMEDNSK